MRKISTILMLLLCVQLIGQVTDNKDISSRIETVLSKKTDMENSLFRDIQAQNIGPTIFSGRVSAIRVNSLNTKEFYVAYASGGLWYTNNNGSSFVPLMDDQISMTIGDFDVNWETDEIWVGTGEVNSSRSSYAGIGMLYSSDKGKTWTHKGLYDSHHIGKVIIDPQDPKTIYVAVLGHLYTTNNERGVYKTTNGGDTWSNILFVNENTGAVDLNMHPTNRDILIASMWERSRKAWNFQESGPSSGIYMTENAGDQWNQIGQSTLPPSPGLGRIGSSIVLDDNDNTSIYILIDNQNPRRKLAKKKDKVQDYQVFKSMSTAEFLKIKDKDLNEFLEANNFPKEISAERIKYQVRQGELKVSALYDYLHDSNASLFNTNVIGAEVYLSKDMGKTWQKTHNQFLDGVYNTYGYYFGLIKNPAKDPSRIIIAGVPILLSDDSGKTWNNINQSNVHVDHHALWINPNDRDHMILGNDGGINISYDAGKNWIKCNSPAVGQFYTVHVDNQEPYQVYGGTQDNGVWMGSNKYEYDVSWHETGKYPYRKIMGGDGMQVQVDKRDPNTVYTGLQFGKYYRLNLKQKERNYIKPHHKLGSKPYRWNWQTPILLSIHQQDILYMGSQKLHRSLNQGDTFEEISNDLTQGGKSGDVSYGTITCIAESPFTFGQLYTGSDDGKVYRTDDHGVHWIDISAGLPADLWVSCLVASAHQKGKLYITLTGYRSDHFESYVYVSEDNGNQWTRIGNNVGDEPVNQIIEDTEYAEILYLGTDQGLYISIDSGQSFQAFSDSVPFVAVHDLAIQEKHKDLIVATHGRSLYKINLNEVHMAFAKKMKSIAIHKEQIIVKPRKLGKLKLDGTYITSDQSITVFSPNKTRLNFNLTTLDDLTIQTWNAELTTGYNQVQFNPIFQKSSEKRFIQSNENYKDLSSSEDGNLYLPQGEYILKINNDVEFIQTKIIIQ